MLYFTVPFFHHFLQLGDLRFLCSCESSFGVPFPLPLGDIVSVMFLESGFSAREMSPIEGWITIHPFSD